MLAVTGRGRVVEDPNGYVRPESPQVVPQRHRIGPWRCPRRSVRRVHVRLGSMGPAKATATAAGECTRRAPLRQPRKLGVKGGSECRPRLTDPSSRCSAYAARSTARARAFRADRGRHGDSCLRRRRQGDGAPTPRSPGGHAAASQQVQRCAKVLRRDRLDPLRKVSLADRDWKHQVGGDPRDARPLRAATDQRSSSVNSGCQIEGVQTARRTPRIRSRSAGDGSPRRVGQARAAAPCRSQPPLRDAGRGAKTSRGSG